jgi:hypothetical protein
MAGSYELALGYGLDAFGNERAFLATPIPLPPMALAGLATLIGMGLIYFTTHRRRKPE